MCGISGIFAFNEQGKEKLSHVEESISTLQYRGPDHTAVYKKSPIAFGHSRLSVIDPSANAHQPFKTPDGNYILVFNGEFYNYQEHREKLRKQGIQFHSNSDTEVLMHLLITEGVSCLSKINGFFSFAFYNCISGEMIIARDRFGIKPLYVLQNEDQLIFGSEIKAILPFGIEKELDHASLYTYLKLNYIPAPFSIYKNIEKMKPGTYWKVQKNGSIEKNTYYSITQKNSLTAQFSYDDAKRKLIGLVENAVESRLIADVPIGAFLSGGIDSSVITAVASKLSPNLNTFSIGYRDEQFFDETSYAEQVATKFNTNHTSYRITKEDMLEHLMGILGYQDEPFADSSALAVSILSQKTRQQATVALSGDGADEIFTGYQKHKATYFAANNNLAAQLIKSTHPLWKALPSSRNSMPSNLVRQLEKLSQGLRLSPKERYWKWASFQSNELVHELLQETPDVQEVNARKDNLLVAFEHGSEELNQTLLSDVGMVLPDDMLTKVDRMSMKHGLEVRVPFLDHSIVEFAFSLPMHYKIDNGMTKKVLRDAFRMYLPKEIYQRPKHGFEVPLLNWFKNELNGLIENELLSQDFIQNQGIFRYDAVKRLKQQLYSNSPGDATSAIWNLLIFNGWWKNNLAS